MSMKQSFIILLTLAVSLIPAVQSADQAENVRKSLIRVTATSQSPDYITPWNPGKTSGGRGAGFVIDGKRIMTNAHVVSDARLLTVEKEGDPNKYVATVSHVAHDCDLALLTVEDKSFFDNTVPLEFGDIPKIESTVSAYGYPIGGDRMSVTRGIVSRSDFQPYSHSAADSHLTIQVDAAINPGNSGGPVLQNGKVVGVAFQGYTGNGVQNTGYMIPVPVITRFLKDVDDGKYDHYVDIAVSYSKMLNPAQRAALGVKEEDRGVMVNSVFAKGSCDGVLETGDVILAIDGIPVASDGYVEIDGQRIEMMEVVERKFLGDKVEFKILRDKQELTATATLKRAWGNLMQSKTYEEPPEYVLFAGLLFQPLGRNFLAARGIQTPRIKYYFERYIVDELYIDHPQLIILSDILSDPVNTYLEAFQNTIIDEVNNTKIRTLQDLADAFAKDEEYYVIRVVGEGRPIVLEAAAVREANPRVMQRYKVTTASRITAEGGAK